MANYFLKGLASIGQGMASIGEGLMSIIRPTAFRHHTVNQYSTSTTEDYSNITIDSPIEDREKLARFLEEMADMKDSMATDFEDMRRDFNDSFGNRYNREFGGIKTEWMRQAAVDDRDKAAKLRRGRGNA